VIPYIELPSIPLWKLTLQPFGILVATGVLVGAWVGRKRAAALGLSDDHLRSLAGWMVVLGFIGAHVFDVLAYQQDKLADDPLLLFKLWIGISSYGGFIGAFAGFLIYWKKTRIAPIPYADAAVWGGVVGFTFGRLGCSVVHDHLGKPAGDFFLAVDVPARVAAAREEITAAGPHHDLGFYEFLYLLVMIAVLYALTRRRRPVGFNVAFVLIAYAVVRFFLEYLRLEHTDPRYVGLTFAQWVSVAAVGAGVYLMAHLYRRDGAAGEDAGGAAVAEGAGGAAATSAAQAPRKPGGSPGQGAGSGKKRKRKKK
jgi:phosphatidylglycerol---prolipoprotein diacylglyceryl transferase